MSERWSRAVFESFGLTVEIRSEDLRITDQLPDILPLCRRADNGVQPSAVFHATREGAILLDDQLVKRTNGEPHTTLLAVGSAVREYLALCAPDLIFIHAGVVTIGEQAVVIPGRSRTGKTTLVAELVRAGATYYSDEFAVVDREGLIHPYPQILTLRIDPRTGRSQVPVIMPAREYKPPPAAAGTLLVTSFKPKTCWQPVSLSPGEGALTVFDNAVAARSRPAEVLSACRRLASGALRLGGERGEAQLIAQNLVEMLTT